MTDTPFPFQLEGVDAILARRRYGLHDEMGLGKTMQIILAANKLNPTRSMRGVVVCPAKLRSNWCNEFRRWSWFPYRVCNGRNIHDYVAWYRGHYNILVTSYEQITAWGPKMFEAGELLDFVALDEAHYIKNSNSRRSRAIVGLHANGNDVFTSFAGYVWHISGTPMINDPLDIYTFLRLCDATPLTEGQFIKRYFFQETSQYGARQSIRPEALAELNYLIDNNRIRRTIEQVGLQIPPVFITKVSVDGDTTAITQLLRDHPGADEAILRAVNNGGLSQLDHPYIMTLRRLIGEAKSVPYAHVLAGELRGNLKNHVVFGRHVQAIRNVSTILSNNRVHNVLVDGSTTDRQAQAYVTAFQEDHSTRVFIGNIQSAGLGSTLTAANTLDLMEQEWAPGRNVQAIHRVRRIGQKKSNIFVRLISLANSFDERVNEIVEDKLRSIAAIEGTPMMPDAVAEIDLTSLM